MEQYSAITDDPKYFVARFNSPISRNWAWTPPLEGALTVVKDVDMKDHRDRDISSIHERLVADDSILPKLQDELDRSWQKKVPSPHPVIANNGPEMMREFGFEESTQGEVIWT